MTILNLAVGLREIAIVTDSRQSATADDGRHLAFPYEAQKCLAFPAMQLLVAHAGDRMIPILSEWHELLLRGSLQAADVTAVAMKAGTNLQRICEQRKWTGSGRIVLAGLIGEAAQAYICDAPAWLPKPVPQGVWISPSLRPLGVDLPSEREPITDLSVPANRPAPTFRDSLRTIRYIADQQHKENPVSCGGTLLESYVDAAGIRQSVLRVLE